MSYVELVLAQIQVIYIMLLICSIPIFLNSGCPVNAFIYKYMFTLLLHIDLIEIIEIESLIDP